MLWAKLNQQLQQSAWKRYDPSFMSNHFKCTSSSRKILIIYPSMFHRYLKERLKQAQEEKSIAKATVTKYKVTSFSSLHVHMRFFNFLFFFGP